MSFFDISEYAHCFRTNPNEAYFWHGETTEITAQTYIHEGNEYDIAYSTTYGGVDNATRIAKENGGKTLEMCMLDHREDLEKAGVVFKEKYNEYGEYKSTIIVYGETQEETKQFWNDCSKSFAKQASGEVHVIEGTDMRQFPILKFLITLNIVSFGKLMSAISRIHIQRLRIQH